MKWKVVPRPEVEDDILKAAKWYDRERAGLGDEFVEEVLTYLTLWQPIHSSNPSHIRRRTFVGAIPSDFLIA